MRSQSQRMSVRFGVIVVAISSVFVGCGKSTQDESQLNYLVANKAYAGLLRKVHQPAIKICMGTDKNSAAHKPDVVHAIEEWTGALTDFAKEPTTNKVEFLGPSDSGCDAVVRIGNYSPAQTSMGNKPTVYLAYNGWYGSRTVTLHEFGHAFGLLDTYSGGGGACQRGQPNSVMCRASYDHLAQDDIDGLRKAYTNLAARKFAADDDRIAMLVE